MSEPSSSVRRLTRAARTRGTRITGDARRALRRRLDLGESLTRHARGLPDPPARLWPAEPDAPIDRGLLPTPLPPAPSLLRWLGLPDRLSADASIGAQDVLLLVLPPGGPGQAGSVRLSELLDARHGAASWGPNASGTDSSGRRSRSASRTVVVTQGAVPTPPADLRRRGVRWVHEPAPGHRAALAGLAERVVLVGPRETGQHDAWRRVAQAAHRPVLDVAALGELDPTAWPLHRGNQHWPTADSLRDAGRSGRLAQLDDAAASGSATAPVPTPERPSARVIAEPRRVVVAGHDLKFAAGLIDHLRGAGHEVRIDRWHGHARHDVDASRALAGWADVVLCEWMLGNAVWYSRHAPRRVRVTARAHLQEVTTGFPARVRHARLDAVVAVAEHVRAALVRDHGVPAARTLVVPNAVRLPGPSPHRQEFSTTRHHTLGLVGMLPARKGLHRALDVAAALSQADPETPWRLRVRGHRPDESGWMSGREAERAYYARQFSRCEHAPLSEAVAFDPHGPDMTAWYERVGVALSVSDFESFHFTLPDAALAGAVPLALAWPGADLIYPRHWLAADVDQLTALIREATATEDVRRERAADAAAFVREHLADPVVLPRLADAVLGTR